MKKFSYDVSSVKFYVNVVNVSILYSLFFSSMSCYTCRMNVDRFFINIFIHVGS